MSVVRKAGSWLLILASWGVLVGLYIATPYMMHARTQAANFIEILIAGCMVAIGVMLLAAGVAMRKPVATMPRAAKMPPVPSVPIEKSALHSLVTARHYLNEAKAQRLQQPTPNSTAAELWNVELAVEVLICMVENAMPKQEGRI